MAYKGGERSWARYKDSLLKVDNGIGGNVHSSRNRGTRERMVRQCTAAVRRAAHRVVAEYPQYARSMFTPAEITDRIDWIITPEEVLIGYVEDVWGTFPMINDADQEDYIKKTAEELDHALILRYGHWVRNNFMSSLPATPDGAPVVSENLFNAAARILQEELDASNLVSWLKVEPFSREMSTGTYITPLNADEGVEAGDDIFIPQYGQAIGVAAAFCDVAV